MPETSVNSCTDCFEVASDIQGVFVVMIPHENVLIVFWRYGYLVCLMISEFLTKSIVKAGSHNPNLKESAK